MRALACVLLLACKSESVAVTTPIATTPPPPPPPSVTASSVSSAGEVADAAPTLEQELAALAQRWNDALARRDAGALDTVYAARVTLYGVAYDRPAAIAAKKAALTSDYTQSIGALMIVRGDPDKPQAVFDKTWTIHGKESRVRGSLAFAKENGRWVVVEETDGKTEEALANASCLGLVHSAVLSTDDGKLYRGNGYGTMYVCGPPECDTFQIAGIHLDDHGLERLASFDVDQKKGVVTHAELVLKADPAIVARMKAACAREAAQGK